jgi:hypothetical protein
LLQEQQGWCSSKGFLVLILGKRRHHSSTETVRRILEILSHAIRIWFSVNDLIISSLVYDFQLMQSFPVFVDDVSLSFLFVQLLGTTHASGLVSYLLGYSNSSSLTQKRGERQEVAPSLSPRCGNRIHILVRRSTRNLFMFH